jgi:hypothetical protein
MLPPATFAVPLNAEPAKIRAALPWEETTR